MDNKLLDEILEKKQLSLFKKNVMDMQKADVAEYMDELDIKSSVLVLRILPKEIAAEVFSFLPIDKQLEISKLVSHDELVEIIDELNFDDKIDLLEEVPANVVKKILLNSTEIERKLINQFLNYPDDSAGSLMTIEFVDLKKEMTVKQAINRIREIGLDKETIYTCYVTNNEKVLEGIISLKDLVLAKPDELILDIMEDDVIHVKTHDDQEIIAEIFKKYDLLVVPVTDYENRMVGIITIDDVVDVIEQENTEDFQRMAAIEPTEEEYMEASVFMLAKKRIGWLAILMFSAMITEFISNKYNYVSETVANLSYFIPMLMGTGGNAGSQASTLVIRGLALGELGFEDIFKVFFRELRVSFLIAVPLAMINFVRLTIISGYSYIIAIAVVSTMMCTVMFAAVMGGVLPLIAKKCKLDPAIMASPLITTIVDASTLLIYFNITRIIFSI